MNEAPNPYVGMWGTADGRIRHELLPDGRYDEARDGRAHANQGSYRDSGSHIAYTDDTSFIADGEFVSLDELHHASAVNFEKGNYVVVQGDLTSVMKTLQDG